MAPRRKQPREGIQQDAHWYRLPVGAPLHDHVVAYGQALQQIDTTRHSKNRARERIYEGQALRRFPQARAALERSGINFADLNATKTVIDTFVSRLSKDRPMPGIETDGADWLMKRKARQFQQFIVGKMSETEFDDLSREALQDGSILGTGWTRIDDADDDVYAERMLDSEVLFDRRECKYGTPQNAITVKRVARDRLVELFPKFRNEINGASPSRPRPDDSDDDDGGHAETDLEDYVDVFEGIHLPTRMSSEDGLRGLCIDTATLVSERWHEPRFPWSMFRLFKPRRGLRGKGFVDQLAQLQHRVNCIVRDLQMNLAAFSRGYVAVNEANDVPVDMLTGWQPFKLKYSGARPPQVTMPQPFNPAQLSALEFFIGQMFDLTGVSRAAATSASALGPGASGVALDTQYDIDSDRFRMPQSNYARYRLTGAQCYLDAAARVARRRKDGEGRKRSWVAVSRSWRRSDSIERLDYNKVALEGDQYQLRIEPVGFLPTTKPGKLSIVEQLAKAGVIPQWLVPTLFEDPDLVQANRITQAPLRNCLRKMDLLGEETKEAPVPCAYNDLDLELKITVAYYNIVEEEGAPDSVLDRYDTYAKLLEALIAKKSGGASVPAPALAPAEQPIAGGVPPMPQGPVPAPEMIGAPPMSPPMSSPMSSPMSMPMPMAPPAAMPMVA